MLETSARLLRLLSLLQARPEWSGPQLAERLGVTTRTVRRDVDKLRGLDYPVEVDLGPTGGYRLGAGAQLPPLLLDDDEAVAVAVTLQTAAGSAGIAGLEENALGALLKLERLLPDRLRRRIAAVGVSRVPTRPGPSVDAASLVAVGGACRDRRVLDLDYTAYDGARTRRSVEPHFDELRRCFAKADDPHKGGTFGIDLRIERQGGKASVSHPRTVIKGKAFEACVVRVFESIDFLKPKGGKTVVSYSLRFTP